MKVMYNCHLTFLHAFAFFLSKVAGQAPSLLPTINGPRSPAGRDDHSHDREPASRIPTTSPPSKILSVIANTPVAQPTPNPPRPPATKNRRHRGPTDSPFDSSTPKPTLPPCPAICSTDLAFNFDDYGSQSGIFDASCLSTSAAVAINKCTLATVQANFFRIFINPSCIATVSLSGATFVPSFYVFGVDDLTKNCPVYFCDYGSLTLTNQGGTTVSWTTQVYTYFDIVMVPASGPLSTYTLHVSC